MTILKILSVIIVLLIESDCFAAHTNKLTGFWQIDKERTFQDIDNDPLIPDEEKKWAKNSVHRRNLIFNDHSIISEYRDYSFEAEYYLIEENDNFVKIIFGQGKCEQERTFYFDGQYVYTKADLEEHKEYYKLIENPKKMDCLPLSETEAFEISNNYAVEMGFNLSKYVKDRSAYKNDTCEWYFNYEGLPYTNPETGEKLYAVDNCFYVTVDSIYEEANLRMCP